MHQLVDNAKENLGIRDGRDTQVFYSGRFSAYNGNVRATRSKLIVGLAREWENRDPDVVQGLIEHLLGKLFKVKAKTPRMALYQDFILYVHREQKSKDVEDDILKDSYDRINANYFGGTFEMPNIKWGTESFRKLGHYHYGSDTVMLSTVLVNELRMLDFVMYHELLHKKHGLTRGGRAHTKAFKADEALYREATEAELTRFVSKQKRGWTSWF